MAKYTYHSSNGSISIKDFKTLATVYVVDDNISLIVDKIRPYDSFAFPPMIKISNSGIDEIITRLELLVDYVASLDYEVHICGLGEDVFKNIFWLREDGNVCWLGKFGIIGLSRVSKNNHRYVEHPQQLSLNL
jgi:hypothetical protein